MVELGHTLHTVGRHGLNANNKYAAHLILRLRTHRPYSAKVYKVLYDNEALKQERDKPL